MNFAMLALDLAKVLTKHFFINTEKEIQVVFQNYSNSLLLVSFDYYALFGMTYDDSITADVAFVA